LPSFGPSHDRRIVIGGAWERQVVPIEECRTRSSYVVRAEVPGLDPARDITVVVAFAAPEQVACRDDRETAGV
jgi:HSP20 family molecular chaperone IbpA